ncbi:hypothetical protein NGF75_08205 [Dietzia kunjamensis]|uniref:acyl-CoA dehydrogenase family protein n=1 Tax=Dietzia kunjamensis TaxID=322509 RepID=UPI002DB9C2C7|nr:acyl-CoA dehydrogenase family protein [Dietzia kunjamensis]MEB8325970.1 hypothetical protein [Dietzia kunjamensis]
MAVEYAGTRQQFRRTIGSFQGIKHKLVDLLVAIELAEATVLDASGGAERGSDGPSAAEVADLVAASRVLASRAAMTAAEEAIQVHGGSGSPGSIRCITTSGGRRPISCCSGTSTRMSRRSGSRSLRGDVSSTSPRMPGSRCWRCRDRRP